MARYILSLSPPPPPPPDTKPSLIRLPNERDLHLEARLGGVELTLCDHQGDVVCAHVIGLETNVDIYEERIDVGARWVH